MKATNLQFCRRCLPIVRSEDPTAIDYHWSGVKAEEVFIRWGQLPCDLQPSDYSKSDAAPDCDMCRGI